MKKLLIAVGVLIGGSAVAYYAGPKPEAPTLTIPTFNIPASADELEKYVAQKETNTPGVKSGNEAKIIWADSTRQKTPVAFIYIHGFSASREEGAPVHTNLAKHFGGNLYLARLAGHGVDLGDTTMKDLTADALINSAEEALAIGRQLGDEVVIIGTSMGGALTTYLASQHSGLKAIVLYSPCIKIYDDNAELLDNPWGLQIARQVAGGNNRSFPPKNELQPRFWSMNYRMEGVVALQNMITHTMTDENFKKVTCPTFMAYYYKDEENQDKVVSILAMKHMFETISTPADKKKSMPFPETGNHVIASYVISDDWKGVQEETVRFLEGVL
jgi:esterase/lipase